MKTIEAISFENNNKPWKIYAFIGIFLTIIHFLLIFLGFPFGDYNHFFGFVALWTSVLWLVAKFKWSKDASYLSLGKNKPKWLEWSVDIFPFVLIFFIARGFLYEPFKIPSGSMEPTLYTGDVILVNKFKYAIKSPISSHIFYNRNEVKRGDIIVFKYPPNPQIYYIKRAIGIPGDTIEYQFQEKKLLINNQEIPRILVKESPTLNFYTEKLLGVEHSIQLDNQSNQLTIPSFEGFMNKEDCTFSVVKMTCKIPQGYYFGMGDNRDNSLDSRFWGFIPEKNITGSPDLSFNILKMKGQLF